MSQLGINTKSSLPQKIFVVVFFIAQAAVGVFGQTKTDSEIRALVSGETVEAELKGDQTHSYNIALAAGQYLRLIVKQKGIDVVVTIYGAEGKKTAEIDSPTGAYGLEPLAVIAESAGNHRLEISSLEKTAAAGRYEVKIKELRPASDQDRQRLQELKTLFNEARKLLSQGAPEAIDSALVKLELAARFYRSASEQEQELHTLNQIAGICFELEKFEKALGYYNQILQLQKSLGDKRGEAAALRNIGLSNFRLGEYQKAVKLYEEAVAFSKIAGDANIQAAALGDIGAAYYHLGDNKKAVEFYQESATLYGTIGKKGDEAYALSLMGGISADNGEYQKALEYYEKALAIDRSIKYHRGEADDLNGIGLVYYELGQDQKALEYFKQSLSLLTTPDDQHLKAATLEYIGGIYFEAGDNQKALEYFNQALPIFKAFEDKDGTASTLNEIGRVHAKNGDQKKAIEFFQQALSLRKEIRERRDEAASLHDIGASFAKLGDTPKALDFYTQALLLRKSFGDRYGEAQTLRELRNLWTAAGNPRLAIFYGKQSVNKFQEMRQRIKGLSRETQQTYLKLIQDNYQKLADLLIAEGRFAEAQQVLALLKEEEYFQYVRRDPEEIKNLKDRVRLRADEQKLIERYALLADRVAQIGLEFQTLDDKKRKLPEGAQLPSEEQKRYEQLDAELKDANAAFRLFLDKELVAELGKPAKKEIGDDRALQGQLREWEKGTVALYTVAGEDRYRVILTTPTVQTDGKTEIKAADLNKKIFAFREALQNPSIDPRPLGKELYDIIIKPIEKDLQAARAKTLIWSLDGALRYLPLAALSPDGKTYLVEKYQTVLITSATRSKLSGQIERNWQALGLGVSTEQSVADPTLPDVKISFGKLPGVQRELTTIVKDEQMPDETGLLTGRRLIDADFNAKNFTDLLTKETPDGKRKYTVVHIASHFRLGDDAANSFLLMGGGEIMTMEQISNSPQMEFGNIELVTLSACNTAFGSGGDATGKEVDSLATFIELRGAKAVMATLWAVADESTGALMSEFYRLRKENPQLSKAEAIRQAQKAMIEGKLKPSDRNVSGCRSEVVNLDAAKQTPYKCDATAPYSHPYFWSPFVLIGNWR